ncbi:MAG: hypothetical protein PF486_02095 [Prolixibacteraceae bacterium]|jgi:hypothetical protein|nr:hypothetical protein [Prolixibacteraceae bacterium]
MKTNEIKERIIKTANELPEFPEEAYKEYEAKIPKMVSELNDMMLSRSDIEVLTGDKVNIEMMKDNHNNHAHFIASILKNFDGEVLVDTILWVFRAYRSRQFHTNYWAAQLNSWRTIIQKTFQIKQQKIFCRFTIGCKSTYLHLLNYRMNN